MYVYDIENISNEELSACRRATASEINALEKEIGALHKILATRESELKKLEGEADRRFPD